MKMAKVSFALGGFRCGCAYSNHTTGASVRPFYFNNLVYGFFHQTFWAARGKKKEKKKKKRPTRQPYSLGGQREKKKEKKKKPPPDSHIFQCSEGIKSGGTFLKKKVSLKDQFLKTF